MTTAPGKARSEGENMPPMTSVEVVMAQLEGRFGRAVPAKSLAQIDREAYEELSRNCAEWMQRCERLERQLRTIKDDCNILAGCSTDRDSFEKLCRVLDAAREVAEDFRSRSDGWGAVGVRSPHLLALAVHVAEVDGEEVSEEDHLAVYGELPAAQQYTREDYLADKADMEHSDGANHRSRRP